MSRTTQYQILGLLLLIAGNTTHSKGHISTIFYALSMVCGICALWMVGKDE